MTTLPVSVLLAELEILAFQALDSSAQLDPFLAWDLHQGDGLHEGVTGAKDLNQLAVHDHLGLPQTPQKGKRLLPFTRNRERRMDRFGEALQFGDLKSRVRQGFRA